MKSETQPSLCPRWLFCIRKVQCSSLASPLCRSGENQLTMHKCFFFLVFMVIILPSLGLSRYGPPCHTALPAPWQLGRHPGPSPPTSQPQRAKGPPPLKHGCLSGGKHSLFSHAELLPDGHGQKASLQRRRGVEQLARLPRLTQGCWWCPAWGQPFSRP